jgi:tetratricopeptide (TPR) repeat protein
MIPFPRPVLLAPVVIVSAALSIALPTPVRADTAGALREAIRLFDQRQYQEARKILEPLATEGGAPAAHYLGRIAMVEEALEAAASWFEKAVSLEPSSSDYHLWLGRAYGRQAMKASILRRPGLASKTRAEFEKAVELDPKNLEARMGLLQYCLRAPGFMGGGEDKALAQAVEISKFDAVQGHRAAALVHQDKDRTAEAEKELRAAAALEPNRTEPFLWLGFFLQEAKQFDKAFEPFEEVLRKEPENRSALYQVGRTAAFSGLRLQRAEECLKKYLALEPQEGAPAPAWAHYRLGLIYEKQGAKDLARAEYASAVSLDPSNEEAKKALKALR